jgi:hypothetical protein
MEGHNTSSSTCELYMGVNMKPFTAFRLLSITLWVIGFLLFSVNSLNAQTVSRRVRDIRESVPDAVPSTSPTASPQPSPTVVPSPSPSSSPANPIPPNKPPLMTIEPTKPEPDVTSAPARLISYPNTGSVSQSQTRTPIEPNAPDPELEQIYKDAVKEYYLTVRLKNQAAGKAYEHNNWALENRKEVLNWQHFSGKVIFGIVNLLVLTGVAFSGIQFFIAMKQATKRKRVSRTPDVQEAEVLPTTFKATLKGVEVSSSILGVIILVVSFAFFYLYLVYVYPIAVLSE